MDKKKPKVIVEIRGRLVAAVRTTMKQGEIDLYVVDWDSIEAGDVVPESSWLFEYLQSDVEEILRRWRSKGKEAKVGEQYE